MKKLLRNTFWLMIIAWSFLLNGYELLGVFVGILITLYIIYNLKIFNYWRVISLFFSFSLISYFISSLGSIKSIYHLLFVFLLIMSLNTGLVNEICLKLKKKTISSFFLIESFTMLFYYALIIVVPNVSGLPLYKYNLVLLTSLIFMPSFMVIGINFIYRLLELNQKCIIKS